MVEYRPTSPWTVDRGRVAQLVEQRTENPRVEGSSPPPTTIYILKSAFWRIFLLKLLGYRGWGSKVRPAWVSPETDDQLAKNLKEYSDS